ncbi:NAD/NADP transhydrogenase beta subunit [Mucilaginibacter gracilis]|uniref:NAD(P) transhydrogenase subunit beta n=1 Tax=Mucilaginibacter gracilis TaxID=423350 RepID=A0A495IUH4_9SPHI|nr:NAD(P)(+) transhydrogenase (Re/Si-specific) subunit beta [Mucilaginibacter gracilis]RKR80340.1 NAD/NADP transhydrogenase beta subunit [Mucilaginibacter gracilis]
MYNLEASILSVCYLTGSVAFITGLKMLAHPDTARRGNQVAAGGMLIAIIATLVLYRSGGTHLHNYVWIAAALAIGAVIGTTAARKVQMTAMPELVSIFNGMGGLCAALISVIEFEHMAQASPVLHSLIIIAGLVIGSVSFSGSMVAYGKLSGKVKDHTFRGQHSFNLIVLALVLFGIVYLLCRNPGMPGSFVFYTLLALSVSYGVFFVLPIGGADMPVVISLLNACTGVATACGGFLYQNPVMLTGGILVGSAGMILTIIMCKAMNRSLTNVLVGSFGGETSNALPGTEEAHKQISISDAATAMAYAKKIMIVPGYGLAVAQAQNTCHELEKLLIEKGVEVKYAIHPVAGRMPGHMNVLLAEANVSYDLLLDMDQSNGEFSTTDVALILGANDVVNPAAENDPKSPIFGMKILDVGLSKMVVVNKRTMKPGYAGIQNQLFSQPNTNMLFGDAKDVLQKLITEIKGM